MAVKQQLLLEVDPEGDFTETYEKDPGICITNYQLAVEAVRHDRCLCSPEFPHWVAQKRDFSPDSETDSDDVKDINSLENQGDLILSENGLVKLEYVIAVCPRSRDHKRRLRRRNRV